MSPAGDGSSRTKIHQDAGKLIPRVDLPASRNPSHIGNEREKFWFFQFLTFSHFKCHAHVKGELDAKKKPVILVSGGINLHFLGLSSG